MAVRPTSAASHGCLFRKAKFQKHAHSCLQSSCAHIELLMTPQRRRESLGTLWFPPPAWGWVSGHGGVWAWHFQTVSSLKELSTLASPLPGAWRVPRPQAGPLCWMDLSLLSSFCDFMFPFPSTQVRTLFFLTFYFEIISKNSINSKMM